MAFFATFIGIDRYADSNIRDLAGARRDATALHALFRDTIADMHAVLLTDDKARLAAVRKAINETFDNAGPDDTVILSFAGHGSRDHRLIAHDTIKADLTMTALPMKDLADEFRRCRAKVVFCILDCCFSGGAPARVLEESPIPRDPGDPLTELVGTGRFLLAASNINEPAHEHPFSRHGVLTNAFIEVLQAAEGQITVGVALDRILAKVRADAEMMGIVQTPVLYGHIEGGLLLPALRPGKQVRQPAPYAVDVIGCNLQSFRPVAAGQWWPLKTRSEAAYATAKASSVASAACASWLSGESPRPRDALTMASSPTALPSCLWPMSFLDVGSRRLVVLGLPGPGVFE